MPNEKLLHIGSVIGPHGVRGLVRVRSLTAEAEAIFSLSPITDATGATEYRLSQHGVGKDFFIAQIDGIDTREAAEALKGTRLFVTRSALPPAGEREYYEADLIGLRVVAANSGEKLGTILALHDYGAGPLLEISCEGSGKSFMLPFTDRFVPEVNMESGYVTAIVPDGWLDDE